MRAHLKMIILLIMSVVSIVKCYCTRYQETCVYMFLISSITFCFCCYCMILAFFTRIPIIKKLFLWVAVYELHLFLKKVLKCILRLYNIIKSWVFIFRSAVLSIIFYGPVFMIFLCRYLCWKSVASLRELMRSCTRKS